MIAERTKVCTRCGENKPWGMYHAARKNPDGTMRGPQARCKDCLRAINSEHRRTPKGRESSRRRDARKHARIMADPERADDQRAYWRDYQRKRNQRRGRGNKPWLWLENRTAKEPRIPNEPLREAIERSGIQLGALATFIDMDRELLRRAVGIKADGRGHFQHTVSVELAHAILGALGLDPVDIGL